jgi:urea transporter
MLKLLSIAGVVIDLALQPEIPVRYLEFWLPVLTIALVVFSWLLVTPA